MKRPVTLGRITSRSYAPTMGSVDSLMPDTVKWSDQNRVHRSRNPKAESQGRLGKGGGKTLYAVRRNDSLSGISQRFGVELIELAQANGLKRSSRIYVGQLLEIPVDPVASLISGHLE